MNECPKCSCKNIDNGKCVDCGFDTSAFASEYADVIGLPAGRISCEEFNKRSQDSLTYRDSSWISSLLVKVSDSLEEHDSIMHEIHLRMGHADGNIKESLNMLPEMFETLVANSNDELYKCLELAEGFMPAIQTIAQSNEPLMLMVGSEVTKVSRISFFMGVLIGKGLIK